MPLFIGSIQSREPVVTGWVTTMEDLTIAIVCVQTTAGDWSPQYGIKVNPDKSHKRLVLPSCFSLDPLAVECLDNALESNNA